MGKKTQYLSSTFFVYRAFDGFFYVALLIHYHCLMHPSFDLSKFKKHLKMTIRNLRGYWIAKCSKAQFEDIKISINLNFGNFFNCIKFVKIWWKSKLKYQKGIPPSWPNSRLTEHQRWIFNKVLFVF